jgi:hypothetical protein
VRTERRVIEHSSVFQSSEGFAELNSYGGWKECCICSLLESPNRAGMFPLR